MSAPHRALGGRPLAPSLCLTSFVGRPLYLDAAATADRVVPSSGIAQHLTIFGYARVMGRVDANRLGDAVGFPGYVDETFVDRALRVVLEDDFGEGHLAVAL